MAKRFCKMCPVRTACLEWALTFTVDEQHGVVGGTYAAERQRMLGYYR
jgi:Transcription factor WhiB